jgi:phosphoglycerate dehydrogenase-like enzyme
MYRVLVAGALPQDALARLSAAAQVVQLLEPDEQSLCREVALCDGLVVRTHVRVSREVLAAGRQLRVVGVAGVGTDNVDIHAAAERGITVLNTAAASSDAVAEFAVRQMLRLLRPVEGLSRQYAAGAFHELRDQPCGRELRELTVGIVGMGRIGSRVGRICAAGYGARVLYNDIVPVGPFAFPAEPVDKPTIWSRCDIISLHVPLTPLTYRMVSADVLRCFRNGALLINTARGAVVETSALVEALQEGRLGGAALDVTDPEPLPPGHPLFRCPNCLVTPHIAARTAGALQRMFAIVDQVIEKLRQTD